MRQIHKQSVPETHLDQVKSLGAPAENEGAGTVTTAVGGRSCDSGTQAADFEIHLANWLAYFDAISFDRDVGTQTDCCVDEAFADCSHFCREASLAGYNWVDELDAGPPDRHQHPSTSSSARATDGVLSDGATLSGGQSGEADVLLQSGSSCTVKASVTGIDEVINEFHRGMLYLEQVIWALERRYGHELETLQETSQELDDGMRRFKFRAYCDSSAQTAIVSSPPG